MEKTVIVTGGAGFIGSALVRLLLRQTDWRVVNIDKLAYSGNLDSLKDLQDDGRHVFVQADIADGAAMRRIFEAHRPDAVMHLAAESHVDRSIDSPLPFMRTNILGTYSLLEASRGWVRELEKKDRDRAGAFRFLHVSTDEVFGDLAGQGDDVLFNENTPYAPSSPYSASKASSDHLARAWHRTYGLPVVITNCSNNYGPRQFPEKLIPVTILNAIADRRLPVYGQGAQIRDWLYVDDHAEALLLALRRGQPGETYAIGGHNEKRNIEVVKAVCGILDELRPLSGRNYADLIEFVRDRPGHDGRYAIDSSRIAKELGWRPREDFASALRKTVAWYLENEWWWQRILDGSYRMERLGVNV